MPQPAIKVENLSKLYKIGARQHAGYRTLRESLTDIAASPFRRLFGRNGNGTVERQAEEVESRGSRVEGQAEEVENRETRDDCRDVTSEISNQQSAISDVPSPHPSTLNPQPSADHSPLTSHHSPDTIWALKDVSFDVQPGEVVGIIGRNGAGKSTLLKILSRITEPTSGRAELHGRVGSLLEVGTGFHPELTGRENIYMNGSILGMSHREIARKFDEIVDFAEIERFLDTPVKRYSSGMHVRLAFAVAAYLEPEILIVDEVLAVGDQAFQKKCLGKMNEVGQSGRTIFFVSHNMAAVLNLCTKVALLDAGCLVTVGECGRVITQYTAGQANTTGSEVDLSNHSNRRPRSQKILQMVRLLNAAAPAHHFVCGEPMTIDVFLNSSALYGEINIGIGFYNTLGVRLFTVATYLSDSRVEPHSTSQRARCTIDELPLPPGRYFLSIKAAGPLQEGSLDMIDHASCFEVVPSDYYGNGSLPRSDTGIFLVRSHWST